MRISTTFTALLLSLVLTPPPAAWTAENAPVKAAPAAEGSDAETQFQAARSALKAEGGPSDPAKTFEMMKRAADQGHAEAEAGLGYLYSTGIGTAKDDVQAVVWFRKGADRGSPKGQFNLGRMIANGRGVTKDLPEGFQWMQRAADQGLPEAVLAVGEAYYFAKFGQKRAYPAAYSWLLKAAQGGAAVAQNMVGVMRQNGRGAPADRGAAEGWFRKAVAQGDIKAESNLGHLLHGQPGDRAAKIEALKWLLVADKHGEFLATKTLAEVLPKTPEADVAEARRLAAEVRQRSVPANP